jgi:hypothetical protein
MVHHDGSPQSTGVQPVLCEPSADVSKLKFILDYHEGNSLAADSKIVTVRESAVVNCS